MSDVQSTLEQRKTSYGNFRDVADVTQNLKFLIKVELKRRDKILPSIHQEALDMICSKLGRIINGDHHLADSWHDIAGYAELVAQDLNVWEGI
jgi:hypothetical protein